MDEQKKKRRDRRAVKKVKIVGPAVYIEDKVVAGGITQEFSIKGVSEGAIANAQRECVLFSSSLLSLMAQNGEAEAEELPVERPKKSEFPPFKTDDDGTVSA